MPPRGHRKIGSLVKGMGLKEVHPSVYLDAELWRGEGRAAKSQSGHGMVKDLVMW